ncbi:MAG TPA: hypothetical protein ENL20_01935, partial [Candidatus Cloacimonetes bacterium]|nr:hypothetical protein [Candidatus Cloacimonadota bacterium]
DIFPGTIAEIGTPAIMRDYRVVTVTVNPFQYDPQTQELKLYKNIDLIVNCKGNGGENPKIHDRKKSKSYESLYASTIVNYESLISRDDEYQDPSYLFIYTTSTSVETYLDLLVDWKHQKGFEVTTVDFASGTSSSTIKSYIQTAYDTWDNPPEFVCLVGDAGGNFNIPTSYMDGGEGDQYYALLEGGDILADLFIGRLSFNYIDELATIVYKILNYEKEPYMTETSWYNEILLVGDPSQSGPSCITTKRSIKEMINDNESGFSYDEIYYGSCANEMNSSMNDGVLYFNYRGYMGMSGWGTDDISSLSNGFMLPVGVFPTCATGDFEGTSDCRSEYFLKAGSATVPKGAIAAIGTATTGTHTCFNNCLDAGTYYGIFQDNIYHMGGALNRGKLNLYLNYPQNPSNYVYKFSYWNNLMGDPGMEVWTGLPQELIITYDPVVPIGSNFLEVTVENTTRAPIEGAWVTALMGDDVIFATDYTDSEGKVYLPIDAETEGTVKLTVTNHNFVPYIGSFDVSQTNCFVNIFQVDIDDSAGNNDGNINPGESIGLNVSLKNYGTSISYPVQASITTDNTFITISDNTENYGTIGAGEILNINGAFEFDVDNNSLGGSEIFFDVTINSGLDTWYDIIHLTVKGPNLDYNDYTVIDGGDGVLSPGEDSDLTVTIDNLESESADLIYGTLSCSNSSITINDDIGYFGNVPAGGQSTNTTNRFNITASANIAPGTQFVLELNLYNNGGSGYNNTVSFILDVGNVSVTDPLGPDSYGYYCYDDEDADYISVPTYSWEEIDPNYAGPGTVIPMSDNGEDTGDTETLTLPFTFPFYGESYNEITVCSNGWITPGTTEQFSSFNWRLPGPLGPSPMIAPFWDDLRIGTGSNVCYYFNSSQHYFIVEWSHLQSEYDSSEETFQTILYDPNYYSTITGDGEIKFQYKVFNNVDIAGYANHGQYSTVGLEDETSMIGLEYTFNNSYPTAAKTLQNETAILFTTNSPTPPTEPYLVIGTISIDDTNGNGNVDYGETVNLGIALNNMGLNGSSGLSAVLSSSDSYITITQNFSNYNDISGGASETNLTDYTFTVENICPDAHNALFELNITGNEGTWDLNFQLVLNAPVIEFHDVFVNDGDNNILDPDETAEIRVSLRNNGGAEASDITSILSSSDTYITINDNSDNLSTLSPGASGFVYYNITTSSSAPVGHSIVFNLDIEADLGYLTDDSFVITIGLNLEDFETGDFTKFPWEFDGNEDWTVVTETPFEGTYCAKSGTISHNQITDLILEVNVVSSGTISFYRKVSSENNYDYLRFYIDGSLQGQWAGSISWGEVSYPVSTGNHIFKWEYDKDGSVSTGSDCAWIDYIIFPPLGTPADISVEPSSFTKTLVPGGSTTDNLYIGNEGGLTLEYSATVNYLDRRSEVNNKSKNKLSRSISKSNREYVVVGAGSSLSGAYDTDITPFGTYYHDKRAQYLFTAAELSSAGLLTGVISSVGFNVGTAGGQTMENFNINMGHTTATIMPAGWIPDALTNQYSGTWTASNGWNDIPTNFIWDGTSNLVVEICFDNSSYTSNSTVYYDVYTGMHSQAYNDNTAGCSDPWETNPIERPQIRLDYTPSGHSLNWLTLDGENTVNGSITIGSPDDVITVLFDTNPDTLEVGTYEANIVITSNDPEDSPITVPVSLVVSGDLTAPVISGITEYSNSMYIWWESVEGATYYKIYSSDDPYSEFIHIDTVTGSTNWNEPITNMKRFYKVTANN